MPLSRKEQKKLLANANDVTPFSQLTYLLYLTTSFNRDDGLRSSFPRKAPASSNSNAASNSLGFTLLDSIAAILAQQYEVVAVCYTSDKVSVMVTDAESPSSGSHALHPLQLAAISNPDYAESASSNPSMSMSNLHNIQIQTEGENLWTKVRDHDGWYCAFM